MPLREVFQTALITGGASCLGTALAVRLASEGLSVAVTSRNEAGLRRAADRIREAGGVCLWRKCDAADATAVETTVAAFTTDLGAIDVLINNAGGWLGTSVRTTQPEAFRRLLDGSLMAAFHFSRAVLPQMVARRTGFILNIGSLAAIEDLSPLDAAAKSGVSALSKVLSKEVMNSGVRIGIIHPGQIAKNWSAEDERTYNLGSRLGAEQVAEIVLFVLSQPSNVTIRELIVTPRCT